MPKLRPLLKGRSLNWLGVVPFLAFALLFLILPTMNIVTGAFFDAEGKLTLQNIGNLFTPEITNAFSLSIRLSLASSIIGCSVGFAIALAVCLGGLPRGLRAVTMTFSGVASNFAGVPLSFAYMATLGRVGFVTMLLRDWFGVNIYTMGFNLIGFWGLVMTYVFFQIPLMVLIITPAVDGLRREWREAAEVLGASTSQYWRMVALPVLWPSLLGTLALLFANSFGAVATAIALTGSLLSIAPILLFNQIRGDVLQDPHLGYALAFGMIVITGLSNGVYIVMRSRAERWMK
ncbi:ABC transporter permease [Cypionkella sp.]|uniref:ABC transporter permease n=1 Tax=Cypionkella sp. TaxID=2811411 RepID=UPI00276E1F28|nr:ABC transporter permease subunit [Cypionkella sp.]